MTSAGIESISLFSALSPRDLDRVAAVTRMVRLEVGHVVVYEGEFAFNFYAITKGAAEVRRHGESVAALGAGDVFGEMGVVPDDGHRWTRRRGATVIVTSPTEAIVIDGSEFRGLVKDIPALREGIHALDAERSRPPGA
jgi:CRP-like cAMP-binding protein